MQVQIDKSKNRMKMINRKIPLNLLQVYLLIFFITFQFPAKSATANLLTLDSCYILAKQNYPLLKQMSLLEKTKEYSLSNISKGYLPQLSINGQATYQSEVTEIAIPMVNIAKLSKDQYKLYGEINQPISDVFVIGQQKDLARSNSEVQEQKLEVDLYNLRDRINSLFFGVLLIDAQISQTELLKKDITIGISKVQAALLNGTSLKSNLDLLHAEYLSAQQKAIELSANRIALTNMLSLFINRDIDPSTKFENPVKVILNEKINRPELKLFDTQKNNIDIQNDILVAKNIPRLNFFFQGGYGRPALNFLDNDFKSYYIGGLRLNWNLSNFYTYAKDKKIIKLNQDAVDIQKEVFLFNTNLVLKQQNAEVTKYEELIKTDLEIISLRENIKITSNSQLENGTITANDFLSFVNAEDKSRQNLLLHQIQLLLAQYTYQTSSGN